MAHTTNNHCSTRYEQSFRHKKREDATDQPPSHNHKVHRKLHQGTQILYTINKPHIHVNFKMAFQGASSRPHCILTTTQSTSSGHVLHMNDTHTSTSAAKKYTHKVFAWTKQNNLTLNPDKTTGILFTPDPAEHMSNLDIKINNTALYIITA